MITISDLIESAKLGETGSMEYVLYKFEPAISSLARKLNYEYAKTDLTIFLIEMIRDIKLERINNLVDGAMVNYVITSLRREAYKLRKKNIGRFNTVEYVDVFESDVDEYGNLEAKLFLDKLESCGIITSKQKNVLTKKYYECYTEQEIANELFITRQGVNKIHKNAINEIKNYLN